MSYHYYFQKAIRVFLDTRELYRKVITLIRWYCIFEIYNAKDSLKVYNIPSLVLLFKAALP